MSAEAFTTPMSCDMRTAPDGRSVLYLPSGEGSPRWPDSDGWASCYCYAETAIELAARAVEEQPMTGISGDHPERREEAAAILRATAKAVRELALDHACDGELTDEDWIKAKGAIRDALG